MTLAESIEESLGNNEQSDQAIIEIRDELRALTDIVDSYKSYALNYNDNMKDFLLSLSEKVKDIYNINWFASESVTEKLTSIDESLTVSNEMKNCFLEEVRQPERAEDYLNEQRENTKMYQSKLTNKLLGDLLKEVKNMGVGGITRDTDREGFLSKALGGLGSSLVGGAAAALGLYREFVSSSLIL